MDIYTPTPKDSSNKYDDIRPYRDEEIPAAMRRLSSDRYFSDVIAYIYGEERVKEKAEEFQTYQRVSEFQIRFMFDAISAIISKTTDGFTFDGFENLEKGKGYLFISNHRDILLDAALLQMALYHNNLECSEITFGNNLMKPGFITDIGKSNRMFKVVRAGNASDFYRTSSHLSEYIRYTINERSTSIWIAQRNGRTKDGFDKTNSTVLKMLSLSGERDLIKNFAALNIVPMSISYEWETCVKSKVRELYLSESNTYIKEPLEDVRSIISGITSPKGRVHIQIGKPIEREHLAAMSGLDRNESLALLSSMIDEQIYDGYKLFNNNYIAYDMLYNSFKYKDLYTKQEYENFALQMHKVLDDWPNELLHLMNIYLKIYSNPLENKSNK